jgi:hypothetical protein
VLGGLHIFEKDDVTLDWTAGNPGLQDLPGNSLRRARA